MSVRFYLDRSSLSETTKQVSRLDSDDIITSQLL